MHVPDSGIGTYVPGQVLIEFRPYVAHKTRENMIQAMNGAVIEWSPGGNTAQIRVPVGSEDTTIATLSAAPGIESATRVAYEATV